MLKIDFTINGNQDDPSGNPMGYKRMLNHSWRKDSVRYTEWLAFVRMEYLRKTSNPPIIVDSPDENNGKNLQMRVALQRTQIKPIQIRHRKAKMNIKITYKDRTHADSDNVFKGIADALFEQDKYLSGSFDFEYGERGKVEIEIIITDELIDGKKKRKQKGPAKEHTDCWS